ncbi:type II toxin-antitoxin system PemI/MazE family antitoxin [Companilactobacillus nodensis]|nr:hypothetical protein [Companilactobacillus nodensis]
MKTIKQDKSVILRIPEQFNIPENIEYTLMKESDGTLIFKPQGENIFESSGNEHADLRPDKNHLPNNIVGRELI